MADRAAATPPPSSSPPASPLPDQNDNDVSSHGRSEGDGNLTTSANAHDETTTTTTWTTTATTALERQRRRGVAEQDAASERRGGGGEGEKEGEEEEGDCGDGPTSVAAASSPSSSPPPVGEEEEDQAQPQDDDDGGGGGCGGGSGGGGEEDLKASREIGDADGGGGAGVGGNDDVGGDIDDAVDDVEGRPSSAAAAIAVGVKSDLPSPPLSRKSDRSGDADPKDGDTAAEDDGGGDEVADDECNNYGEEEEDNERRLDESPSSSSPPAISMPSEPLPTPPPTMTTIDAMSTDASSAGATATKQGPIAAAAASVGGSSRRPGGTGRRRRLRSHDDVANDDLGGNDDDDGGEGVGGGRGGYLQSLFATAAKAASTAATRATTSTTPLRQGEEEGCRDGEGAMAGFATPRSRGGGKKAVAPPSSTASSHQSMLSRLSLLRSPHGFASSLYHAAASVGAATDDAGEGEGDEKSYDDAATDNQRSISGGGINEQSDDDHGDDHSDDDGSYGSIDIGDSDDEEIESTLSRSRRLNDAAVVLVDRLCDFLAACPEVVAAAASPSPASASSPSSTAAAATEKNRRVPEKKGLALPASAVGWLSSNLHPELALDDGVFPQPVWFLPEDGAFDGGANEGTATENVKYYGAEEVQELSHRVQTRLALLLRLLPRATHVRVTHEAWPPPPRDDAKKRKKKKKKKADAKRKRHRRNRRRDAVTAKREERSRVGPNGREEEEEQEEEDENDGAGDASSAAAMSSLNSSSSVAAVFENGNGRNDDDDNPAGRFRSYVRRLKHRPWVDASLFPNLEVLVLHRVPPDWIVRIDTVRDRLRLIRIERGCVYDLDRWLFPPSAAGEDDDEEEDNGEEDREKGVDVNSDDGSGGVSTPRRERRTSSGADRLGFGDDVVVIDSTSAANPNDDWGNDGCGLEVADDISSSAERDEALLPQYPSLSHLKLSHCAIGELSGLLGNYVEGSTFDHGRTVDPWLNGSLMPSTAKHNGGGRSYWTTGIDHEEQVGDAPETEWRRQRRKRRRPPPLSRLPRLKTLCLSHNELVRTPTAFAGLSSLPRLTTVDLSFNQLSCMDDIFLRLGNIRTLILSGNRITTACGLDRLYSLERLSLDKNRIERIPDIAGLAKLPQLTYLDLKGNPVEHDDPSTCRVQVLNLFRESRSSMLPTNATYRHLQLILPVLDGTAATKKELFALKELTFVQSVSTSGPGMAANLSGVTSANHNVTNASVTLLTPPDLVDVSAPVSSFDTSVMLQSRRRTVKSSRTKVVHIRDFKSTKAFPSEETSEKHIDDMRAASSRGHETTDDSFCTIKYSANGLLALGHKSKKSNERSHELPSRGGDARNVLFTIEDIVAAVSTPNAFVTDEPSIASLSSNKDNEAAPLNISKKDEADYIEKYAPSGLEHIEKQGHHGSFPVSVAYDDAPETLRSVVQVDLPSEAKRDNLVKNLEEEVSFITISAEEDSLPTIDDKEALPSHLGSGYSHEEHNTLIKEQGTSIDIQGKDRVSLYNTVDSCKMQRDDIVVDARQEDESALPGIKESALKMIPISKTNSTGIPGLEGVDYFGDDIGMEPELPDLGSSKQSNFPEDVWGDAYKTSTQTNGVVHNLCKPHDFDAAEKKAAYDGPPLYASLCIKNDIELYFRSYVFPLPSDDEDSMFQETDVLESYEMMPRIQLYKFDREIMLAMNRKHSHRGLSAQHMAFDMGPSMQEKLVQIWRIEAVPCGDPATLRLVPNRKPRRGFHGEIVWIGGKDARKSECRKLIICLSDLAIYFIQDDSLNNDSTALDAENSAHGKRRFPSQIPRAALFKAAIWPHAIACHPLEFLHRITIGFGFQRLILHFSVPDEDWRSDGDLEGGSTLQFTYVLLTCNKLRTISLLQKLQSQARETKLNMGCASFDSVAIDNDDKVLLDALGLAIAPTLVGGVLHYQLLRQRWKRGDRDAVRRSFVLTDTAVYLLDENYLGDGTCSPSSSDDVVGNVSFEVVDSADIDQLLEVRAADADPRSITLVTKAPSRLKRSHRWRLFCHDGEGAERLVDDVRKAMATASQSKRE